MTDSESGPRRPEVTVAVVASGLGVLIGRRRDRRPPWTFPGGKIEPGESAEDAAMRETLEETRGERLRGHNARSARSDQSRKWPIPG
jgi:8-oxo-dGTP pyrophosphatase MutT (NUDIX family)